MNTNALNQEYDRAIPARFVTRRDGSPMHCVTCNTVLVEGQAAAAVTGDRQWHSYCADCAATPAAQIRGLYKRIAEMGADIPATVQDQIRAFLTNETSATFLATKYALMDIRTQAAQAARAEALAQDPTFVSLALATTPGLLSERDRTFAESLATQWEVKGHLSEKQMPYAIKLGDKARKADGTSNVRKDWTAAIHVQIAAMGLSDGYYAVDHVGAIEHQDTTFVRILTADDGTRFMRHIVGGQGETPAGGEAWCTKVLAQISLVGAEESMRRYGRQIGRCCKCHRTLTDLPSRQAGIGPVCGQAGF
jgi:Family of unknown function (DUF6011)